MLIQQFNSYGCMCCTVAVTKFQKVLCTGYMQVIIGQAAVCLYLRCASCQDTIEKGACIAPQNAPQLLRQARTCMYICS